MSRQQRIAAFAALLFAALALAPAMAHLLELPNKIDLPREHYLQVQQIYRGWALAGLGGAAHAVGVFARRLRRAQPLRVRGARRVPDPPQGP